ncbi:hypothetical protein SSX86_011520 [Deinandra increscens subsp. villosa]|uniref:Uncharacterized protein n=1 Tax=Deinandra increscens subsp. villosa TaxID=3103831 RepID=A0AAP0H234_9ASTR
MILNEASEGNEIPNGSPPFNPWQGRRYELRVSNGTNEVKRSSARHLNKSHSEEHLPPPSYRGCWHGVSRGFFLESCHDRALDERALQAALPFFTHAILLDRAFAHCPRFPTAAPRGSPGRVSVPVWLIIRKDQLSILSILKSVRTSTSSSN